MTKCNMTMFEIIELNMIEFDTFEYNITECTIIASGNGSKSLITFKKDWFSSKIYISF